MPGCAPEFSHVSGHVDRSGEAGLTLVHLALAFVLNHPAVTAPIVGPRTWSRSPIILNANYAWAHLGHAAEPGYRPASRSRNAAV
jgi:aryl-alcohol dehydrogenase-like predicted oxidoreductase